MWEVAETDDNRFVIEIVRGFLIDVYREDRATRFFTYAAEAQEKADELNGVKEND